MVPTAYLWPFLGSLWQLLCLKKLSSNFQLSSVPFLQRYNANGGWKERVKSGFFILGAEHMNSDLILRPKLIHFMEKGQELFFLV